MRQQYTSDQIATLHFHEKFLNDEQQVTAFIYKNEVFSPAMK